MESARSLVSAHRRGPSALPVGQDLTSMPGCFRPLKRVLCQSADSRLAASRHNGAEGGQSSRPFGANLVLSIGTWQYRRGEKVFRSMVSVHSPRIGRVSPMVPPGLSSRRSIGVTSPAHRVSSRVLGVARDPTFAGLARAGRRWSTDDAKDLRWRSQFSLSDNAYPRDCTTTRAVVAFQLLGTIFLHADLIHAQGEGI